MRRNRMLLWTARACLVISLLTISILSYYYYPQNSHPSFWEQLGLPMAHVLQYGGPLIFLTIFTWVFPAAGGICSIFYFIFQIISFYSGFPETKAYRFPTPLHFPLQGLFFLGGVINVYVGIVERWRRPPGNLVSKQLLWTARVTALAPVVINVILHWFIFPASFLLGSIPGLIITGIAWFWPAPGGLLMLLITLPGSYLLFESNWDFQQKLPVYIFLVVFTLSGLLHLYAAWLGRKACQGNHEEDE
ncbi:hypothetical protein ACFLW1_02185 [Chloroflexota bacterium]